MTLRVFPCRRLALALVAAAVASLPAVANERPRGVIELFTSQGCSSCPPADRLLARYADHPDVIALSYPVQIWDYLGWRDTLASPENTQRHKAYAEARGDRRVYTPQAVVNGIFHAVGSSQDAIEQKLAARGPGRAAGAMSVPVTLTRDGDRVLATVGAAPDGATVPMARVVFVVFERRHRVSIQNGENRGVTLEYRNVVRRLVDAGPFTGAAQSVAAALPAGADTGTAVLIQAQHDAGPGLILGAAMLR